LRLIGSGKLDHDVHDLRRQRQRLRLDLEDCRADNNDVLREQPDGAKLDLSPLAQV
jgi:hypothetical protein